jgi:hypothetical protein
LITALLAGLYWEHTFVFNPKGVSIPAAVSAFPEELYQAPRSWAERAYPKLIQYNKPVNGGHVAAWEQPGRQSSARRSNRDGSYKVVRWMARLMCALPLRYGLAGFMSRATSGVESDS